MSESMKNSDAPSSFLADLPVTTLILEPVESRSVQGRSEQSMHIKDRKSGTIKSTRMKKRKATGRGGIGCYDGLIFKADSTRTRYKAGMQEPVPNMFKNVDPEEIKNYFMLSEEWLPRLERITKQDSITKQTELEIRAGVESGTYTDLIPNQNRLSGAKAFFDPEKPKTVIQAFKARLYDETMVITDETPRGALLIQLIRNRPDRIAPNKQSAAAGRHFAYIARENEGYLESKAKNDRINKAIAALVEVQESQTARTQWMLASTLTWHDGRAVVTGETIDIRVDTELNRYIKDKGAHQMENVTKFLKVTHLLKENKGMFRVMFLSQLAVQFNLCGENNGFFFWHSQRAFPERLKFTNRETFEAYIFTQLAEFKKSESTPENNGYAALVSELEGRNVFLGTRK